MSHCPCPPGYTLDSSGKNCVQITTSTPTTTGTFYGSQVAGPYPEWCKLGTNFYQDITSAVLPLSGNASNILDGNGTVVPVVNTVVSPLWGQFMNIGGPFYGRLNECGLWTNLPLTPNLNFPGLDDYPPIGEWIGFSACVNVPTTGTYCIGVGADNCFRFKLNGQLIAEVGTNVSGGHPFNFNYWHVFPITLQAGSNIISLEGLNQALVGAFGAEIYNATAAQLAALATPAQLSAVTVFTTKNLIGQNFQTGQNSGYSCGSGCVLNLCGPSPVCTCYNTIPAGQGCCYRLENCVTGQLLFTNADLSQYVGQTVSLSSGCWQVTTVDCEGKTVVSVGVLGSFTDCVACLPCYALTDCDNPRVIVTTNTDLSQYIGQTIQIAGYPEKCWRVSSTTGCTSSTPVQLTSNFSTCAACKKKCYLLVDCAGAAPNIIVDNDLSASLGFIVQIKGCPDICWQVQLSNTCVGATTEEITATFQTCVDCNPPVVCPAPELLRQRKVYPGYDTPGCSTEYTEKVNCRFAEQVWNQIKKRRYGITVRCDDEYQKWMIKKQLLDLRAIYDPELCRSCAPITCCTPCPVVEPTPPVPTTCPAPSNIVVVITVNQSCEDAEGPATAVISFNNPSTNGL